jgi:succinate dehydrogenase/fumarate reductase flavoprotein subunit
MLETPVKRLLYKGDSNKGDGEVIGVIAESEGQEIAIKARQGVCLGTGGFNQNRQMRQEYLRGPVFFACAAPLNTGDGHKMAMAVGANLRNMNETWGLVSYMKEDPDWRGFGDNSPEPLPLDPGLLDWQMFRGKPGAITVNRFGKRFMNESACYDASGKTFYHYNNGLFEWSDIPGFVVFSSDYLEHYPLPDTGYVVGEVPDWMAGPYTTLNELATAMGIDATNLATTVETFNGYAASGVDPEYHRGEFDFDKYTAGDMARYEAGELANACMAPLAPPYYGAKLWPGSCGTNGGPQTNGNAQVLNVWGQVIPRLYASGNVMASCMGAGYGGGGSTLGPGFTFGYLAGKHVATLAPW